MSITDTKPPSEAIDRTYRAMVYRVSPPLSATLKVGSRCSTLDLHLGKRKAEGAVFISAGNPLGRALSEEENLDRDRALNAVLKTMSVEHWSATRSLEKGGAKPIPGRLILPIELQAALEIAKNFEQLAMLYHPKGQKTQIIYTGLTLKGK